MICAAKPRYAAASTREHLRVLAPRLVAPSTQVTSLFHTRGEIVLEMSQRRVLWARIKGEAREVQARRCDPSPGQSAATSPPRALHHHCTPMPTQEVLAAQKHQQHALARWPGSQV